MKIYYDLGFKSRGIERVISAMDRYRPSIVEKVSNPNEADLVVLHIIGRHDHVMQSVDNILTQGKPFVAIQYALQSTRNPNPEDWLLLWNKAKLVWSYYDISLYCPNFYHAPLAADPEVFYPIKNVSKNYMVGTTGNSYETECIGEVRLAAWNAKGMTTHIGHRLDNDPNTSYYENITDTELCGIYNAADWWSCLRRKDGFELGAVESLLCGTRPIVFDNANYRQWFDGLAEFVPECESGTLSGKLKRLFLNGPKPVTKSEMKETKSRFNWETIIGTFWDCLLHQ